MNFEEQEEKVDFQEKNDTLKKLSIFRRVIVIQEQAKQ